MNLSLCMIVKNEEEVLARCLESARPLVEEIVIVDTGSTDRTKEIAAQFTDRIFSFEWTDDFSAARNFSFSKAHGDYILWLDADDVITQENAVRLIALKRELDTLSPDVVICPYDTSVDEKGNVLSTCNRERIIKNDGKRLWQGCVHECLPLFGTLHRAPFRVTHMRTQKSRGSRNLDIYRKQLTLGKPLDARDLFYYGRELYYHRLYTESEAVLQAMLRRPDGWSVNQIEACKTIAACRREQRDPHGALQAYFQSFLYGEPRASVLVGIAEIFKDSGAFERAIFWFEAALHCKSHLAVGDFEDAYDLSLYPTLGLVYCHYRTGNQTASLAYHQKCRAIAPDHPSVVYNETFFSSKKIDS